MENRTAGIVATVAAVVICGCSGLMALVFGILAALHVPFHTTVNGVEGNAPLPATLGYVLLCLSLLLFAVPVAVGFVTLRRKAPAPPAASPSGETIPPPS